MKTKRASIFTKLVVLGLTLYAVVSLVDLRGKLLRAEEEKQALAGAVQAQAQENAALSYEIEHSDDADTIASFARDRLGLVMPNEKIFYPSGG